MIHATQIPLVLTMGTIFIAVMIAFSRQKTSGPHSIRYKDTGNTRRSHSLIDIPAVDLLGMLFRAIVHFLISGIRVSINPKVAKILAILPGTDCGACGYLSCNAFALAVSKKRTAPDRCIPGGPKTTHTIADLVGVSVEPREPMMAVVHCRGGKAEALERAYYEGLQDCRAAVQAGNGSKMCSEGCLGLGTCVRACRFDAIYINANGIAVVDSEKCAGCGKCIESCPRSIITMIPRIHKIYLACSNHDLGGNVRKYCTAGCTGCNLCVKVTKSGAISMEDYLPVLDYGTDENYIPAAFKCPQKCFVDLVRVRPKVNIDTKCDGCGECIPDCPVEGAIKGEKGQRHIIDKKKCIGCGICLNKCHAHALSIWGGLGYDQTAKSKRTRRRF